MRAFHALLVDINLRLSPVWAQRAGIRVLWLLFRPACTREQCRPAGSPPAVVNLTSMCSCVATTSSELSSPLRPSAHTACSHCLQ